MTFLRLVQLEEKRLDALSRRESDALAGEAHDLDDALRVAATIPPGRLASIEVRPIRELAAP